MTLPPNWHRRAQDFPDTVSPDIGASYRGNPCACVNALLVGVMPRALLVRAVPYYRCYYLDSADRVASTDVIACDTDSQAQALQTFCSLPVAMQV